MAYFIFIKNSENIISSLHKIAENQQVLDNIIKNEFQVNYTILEDTQQNFEDVRLSKKIVAKYNNNTINYEITQTIFNKKEDLENYINNFKSQIKSFLDANLDHVYFNMWNNYLSQLNQLNLSSFVFPLNKSLEQYFSDLNQTYLHPLQLP
jgi:hypothetical protein